MWWFYFLVTGVQLTCLFTQGCPNGKTYCSCFFPSVVFYSKLQNIALVKRDQLQHILKKDKCKYQLFFKRSFLSTFLSFMSPVCHLMQFSVYLCQCEYMYVFVCGSSCASECDVLICMWRIDKNYFNVEHN